MTNSARDILKDMADTYSSCRSYRDDGEVVTVMIEQSSMSRRQTEVLPFKTLFERPDLFRFEFRDKTVGLESEWERYVIVSIGASVRRYWSVRDKMESPRNLSMALAGAAGVSGCASHTVPFLLLPQVVGGWHFADVKDAFVEATESIQGEVCHRLRVSSDPLEVFNVWIGQSSHLLRKIFTRRVFNQEVRANIRQAAMEAGIPDYPADMDRPHRDFIAESTTTYMAFLNVQIARSEFDQSL